MVRQRRMFSGRIALPVVLALLLSLAAACGGESNGETAPAMTATPAPAETAPPVSDATADLLPEDPGPLSRIAVSTPVIADIVSNIVGERARTLSVIPPGADPHTYEPTPREVAQATESDLFIYMGANLEDYLRTSVWRRALRGEVPAVELSAHLDLIEIDRIIDHGDHVHDLTGGDPHVWLDPLRVIELVEVVVAALVEHDEAASEYYRDNADAYIAELERLHEEYLAVIQQIPEERRKLVVFHDAYTYFEDRYGFQVIGVVLQNPQAEPSARALADLHGIVEEAGIQVVFKEPQFNAQIVDQLARDRGIEVGLLMTDTFTDEVTTYLDLMRFNLRSLEQHLAT
jgi:ABC-type Zn uptake system ZnuABC Zn-binding protein ZnuA